MTASLSLTGVAIIKLSYVATVSNSSEIELILASHPGVKQCVVAIREDEFGPATCRLCGPVGRNGI